MERILKIILDYPKLVVIFFITASVFCSYYSLNFLEINTSTDNLINKNLNFKKNQEKLKKEFPVLANNIFIRILGDEEIEVDNSANRIIGELEKRQELSFLYSPNNDEVFKESYFNFEWDSFLLQSKQQGSNIEAIIIFFELRIELTIISIHTEKFVK